MCIRDRATITTTEKGLEEFEFDFKVIKPGLSLSQNGLVSQNNTSLTYMKLSGEINTSDVEDAEKIEKAIELDFSKSLKIKWQHEPDKHRSIFTIDSIQKTNGEQNLVLKWNGDAIDADDNEGEELSLIHI